MARITINGISLDPVTQGQALQVAGLASADASKSDYILIQTTAPLSPDQKDQLTKLGIIVHEYVSDNTYLCGYKPTDLAKVRTLPFVVWAEVYLVAFKVAAGLRPKTTGVTASVLPTAISRTTRSTSRFTFMSLPSRANVQRFFAAPKPPGRMRASRSGALTLARSTILPRAMRADSARTPRRSAVTGSPTR